MLNCIIRPLLLFVLLILNTTSFAIEQSKTDSLISRSLLFSDPKYTQVQISPDGNYLAYLAPHKGVLNVWVGIPRQASSMHPITHNEQRGISSYIWAYNNEHILYVDDNQGNEDWRLYAVSVKTNQAKELVSLKKTQVRMIATSHHFPDEILVGLNQRRSDFHDVYKLNIRSGTLSLVYENNSFTDFVCDHNLTVRLGLESTPEGGAVVYKLGKDFSKTELFKIAYEDIFTTSPYALNKTGDILYLLDSRNRNTSALTSLNLQNNELKLIAENQKADIDDILLHPTEFIPQAYTATYEKQQWSMLDNSIEADMNYLKNVTHGELQITSRSLDDKIWTIVYIKDNGAPHYYYYDRPARKAEFLFSAKPNLDEAPLVHMEPVIIQSRDNLPLVSYLSLPLSFSQNNTSNQPPVPMVLLVHGGPNARDYWGYNGLHQWLANRGYAVLSVNYRGSSGFGKEFANAGNGQWGAKMHDDLIDAVEWAIQKGITARDKIGIMGGSYGGYATLIGLTKTPDVFACGIDIVGPSNLTTLMNSIPDYWKPMFSTLKRMIGADPSTEEGRAFLATHSPITYIEHIKKPLLIGQGANDPRVKQAESEQIVNLMVSKHIPVTYLLYPDEGHGFSRPENRLSFYAVTEGFLAQYLHGKFEPVKNDFKNSTIEIKTGKEYISVLMNENLPTSNLLHSH